MIFDLEAKTRLLTAFSFAALPPPRAYLPARVDPPPFPPFSSSPVSSTTQLPFHHGIEMLTDSSNKTLDRFQAPNNQQPCLRVRVYTSKRRDSSVADLDNRWSPAVGASLWREKVPPSNRLRIDNTSDCSSDIAF